MILQIKTHNYHMIEGSIPVALIFKISYKAMITAFSTQHKFQSKRDETLLLQTDLSRANTVIPKPIQWKDVNLPEEWILEGAAPPAIPKQLEPNTELQNVTQYSDGKVKLSFRRSNSFRFSDKASCSSIPSLEKKFTKVPSVINLPFQSQPRFSTSDLPSSSISSVDYTTKSDFAKAIREQLDRIEATSSSSSKVQIAPDTPQSSKIDTPQLSRIGVLDQDQVSIASSDLEAFTEEPIPKANKIHWELALPTSKSPPDLTIDNRPSALNQARYNATSVYEWNIDGMSEYNILGVLQQMTMAANAYKTQSGTSDKAIAEILIAGFTGQLKGWWDHLLTKLQQLDILNAIQNDENSAPILDDLNNPIQDAVMAPKKRIDKGKAPASQTLSKEPPVTPSKEKLLSSAMPIKSWIELVEEHEAKYKSISSEDQSLPNWFHHWWNYFGPTSEILTPNALQCLNLFKANYKPTESEKRFPPFLCFCTNFFLPWVWMWSLRHHTQDSHFILQRTFRVKWWSKFDKQTKLTPNLVQNWLSAQGHLQPAIKDIKAQGTFLTQKSKAQALLASAKTEEEYFKAMEQLLASRSKSLVADSTEEDDDDDDEPTVSLGDENEDDCFGIFSPVKHCK
ncbi:hypothetical protein KPL71_007880 [Citrus sinensis]|uniref:Uncharacterized protein n=1 Tax=Citrus sinensis TaxID=2711 RepID=A0ACB8M223_CITSI|nr:hypothetical protein KPL71_007880 [Citrus sinensis]